MSRRKKAKANRRHHKQAREHWAREKSDKTRKPLDITMSWQEPTRGTERKKATDEP